MNIKLVAKTQKSYSYQKRRRGLFSDNKGYDNIRLARTEKQYNKNIISYHFYYDGLNNVVKAKSLMAPQDDIDIESERFIVNTEDYYYEYIITN